MRSAPFATFWLSVLALGLTGLLRAETNPRSIAPPNPARFAKDIAKFDAEETSSNPPPRGGIVFTGSSSVRYWKVKEAFLSLPVINRGFGGSVAHDLVFYADRVAVRYQPKVLVVYTGGNDLHAKMTPKEALGDYTAFVTYVHEKLPKTLVIVNSVKPAPVRASEVGQVKELNQLLEAWCKERPWITWVDSAAYLYESDGKLKVDLYRPDHLHLNEAGYAQWNELFRPLLEKTWAEAQRE